MVKIRLKSEYFQGLKVWFRFSELENISFQEKYGTKDNLDAFKDVFLHLGGICRETCTVKKISRKGWSLRIDALPLGLAKQICQVVRLLVRIKKVLSTV